MKLSRVIKDKLTGTEHFIVIGIVNHYMKKQIVMDVLWFQFLLNFFGPYSFKTRLLSLVNKSILVQIIMDHFSRTLKCLQND